MKTEAAPGIPPRLSQVELLLLIKLDENNWRQAAIARLHFPTLTAQLRARFL
jgi:hypothetical protein